MEGVGALEVAHDLLAAHVVEAHAVDDAFGRNQAEASGLGIAGLAHGSDRADFDVPEAQGAEGAHALAVLVHAGRQTDRVGKADPHDFDGIFRRGVREQFVQTERGDPVEIGHDHMVGRLRLHLKKDAFGEFVEHDCLSEDLPLIKGEGRGRHIGQTASFIGMRAAFPSKRPHSP